MDQLLKQIPFLRGYPKARQWISNGAIVGTLIWLVIFGAWLGFQFHWLLGILVIIPSISGLVALALAEDQGLFELKDEE